MEIDITPKPLPYKSMKEPELEKGILKVTKKINVGKGLTYYNGADSITLSASDRTNPLEILFNGKHPEGISVVSGILDSIYKVGILF